MAKKPIFRNSFNDRRCIIPASGFFEWTYEKGPRQQLMFTAADGSPVLAFAGLCGRWRDAVSGDDISSCTIVVSGACAWMTPYHDRMPVLFEAKDFDMARRIASSRRAEPVAEKGLRE